MESNFHSTVLQRPPSLHDYEDQQRDRDRERERERERGSSERRHRDILNPVQQGDNNTNPPPGPGSHAPGQQQQHPHQPPPPPRHSFSLRSPTQPDFHHAAPPHFPGSSSASPSSAPSASAAANTNASTSTSTNGTSSGTRSLLHNPFLTSSAAPPSLPPPVHPSSIAPPRSPLHAPPVFYPQDMRDHRESPREKTAGSFYDPTTDTTTSTSDRRVSDSGSAWHNATQAPSASSASKVSKTSPQESKNPSKPIEQSKVWLPDCTNACCLLLAWSWPATLFFLTGANASGTRQTTPLHNRAMLATLTSNAAGPSGPSCSSQDHPWSNHPNPSILPAPKGEKKKVAAPRL